MVALNAGLLLCVLGTMVWAALLGRREKSKRLAKQQHMAPK